MQSESLNTSKKKENSQHFKINSKNIICKDGFCQLPNLNEKRRINEKDNNLFDPIQ
tara:strand:- start:65 stop:232 length:168 start_codon:yes stop_codon:yes gene_type:complete